MKKSDLDNICILPDIAALDCNGSSSSEKEWFLGILPSKRNGRKNLVNVEKHQYPLAYTKVVWEVDKQNLNCHVNIHHKIYIQTQRDEDEIQCSHIDQRSTCVACLIQSRRVFGSEYERA